MGAATSTRDDGAAAAVLDLDARRAARLEAAGTKTVRHGGAEWRLQPEVDMRVVEDMKAGDVAGAVSKILADPGDTDGFLAVGPFTFEDFAAIMQGLYGAPVGN